MNCLLTIDARTGPLGHGRLRLYSKISVLWAGHHLVINAALIKRINFNLHMMLQTQNALEINAAINGGYEYEFVNQ